MKHKKMNTLTLQELRKERRVLQKYIRTNAEGYAAIDDQCWSVSTVEDFEDFGSSYESKQRQSGVILRFIRKKFGTRY